MDTLQDQKTTAAVPAAAPQEKKEIPLVCPILSIMQKNLYPCIKEKCMLHYKTWDKDIHCSLANPLYKIPKDEDGIPYVSINNIHKIRGER